MKTFSCNIQLQIHQKQTNRKNYPAPLEELFLSDFQSSLTQHLSALKTGDKPQELF